MLRYFQWLAVAGVWGPLLVVASWFALSALISFAGGDGSASGWGFAVGGMFIAVAAAHALAVSSLVGVGLLVVRKTGSVPITAVSAVIGGSLSALVLARIYFNFGP